MTEGQLLESQAMLENQLASRIETLCLDFGWRRYHTHRSKKSAPGFPDETVVHGPWRRLVFAELKREKRGGRKRHGITAYQPTLTRTQADWLDDLCAVQPEVYLWLPRDWVAGTVQRCLMQPRGDEHDDVRACGWSVRRYVLDDLGIKVVRK